jgi:probable F420-dependent oxidoreductase
LSTPEPAPVVEDLSAFIIAGAVSDTQPPDAEGATDRRTPAMGIEDGVAAERLGFRRVFLSERLDIKYADVILSGIGARTSRIQLATGVIVPTQRHPWVMASFGMTMHACYGPRFVLGIGRSDPGWLKGSGLAVCTYEYMEDYVGILRRLWAGQTVSYDGPVGRIDGLHLQNRYSGPPPAIWFGNYGLQRGSRLVAEFGDGVVLPPMLTPRAVGEAAARIRAHCRRIGRDPAEVRVCASVVTAPDMDERETRAIAHARLVTYLTYPDAGDTQGLSNDWDPAVIASVRAHRMFQGLAKAPDLTFHRSQMMDVAALIPDEWIHDTCAVGTVDECVAALQRYLDAGADEIATYGSTPAQNAGLIAAWRDRKTLA